MKTKNFALIGAAGYIAPRHMQAIKDTGNQLVAAMDPSDSVGILDRYFNDVDFFTEFERFDRHIEKLRRLNAGNEIDYVSICSPNYLHDSHMRFALRAGADAICEKPLVMNPWNLEALEEIERESGHKIYNILQLRAHPAIKALKQKTQESKPKTKVNIDLSYITSRGKWYQYSWKGNNEKSGGVATNIGIHFFDMLMWVYGKPQHSEVHLADFQKMSGFVELENANVRWLLSVDKNDLPKQAVEDGRSTFRSILVNGQEIEFSGGFTDLHTEVYVDILSGKGYGISDARPSIELVHDIRHSALVTPSGDRKHPLLK